MSLEQSIAELTAVVRELTSLVARNGANVAAVTQATQPAAQIAPAVAPAVVPAGMPMPAAVETRTFTPSQPPATQAPGETTFAEAQQRLAAVAQRLGSPQRVIEVMQPYGGPPLTAVAPTAYAQLVAQAEALM